MTLGSDGGELQCVWQSPSPHPKLQLRVVHPSRSQSFPVLLSLFVVDQFLEFLMLVPGYILQAIALPGSVATALQHPSRQGRGLEQIVSDMQYVSQSLSGSVCKIL